MTPPSPTNATVTASPSPSPLPGSDSLAALCRRPLADWLTSTRTFDERVAQARARCAAGQISDFQGSVGTCGPYRCVEGGSLAHITREFYDPDGALVAAESTSDIISTTEPTCEDVRRRQYGIWTGCSFEKGAVAGLSRYTGPLCPPN